MKYFAKQGQVEVEFVIQALDGVSAEYQMVNGKNPGEQVMPCCVQKCNS